MSMRLRDLIKLVRAAKTANEEREIISKECAAIRTSFKEEEADYRPRNIAKLIYVNQLNYPTHFGQMECLKLIVSPHYSDKRIGYLALMLLLDERQEVLMLVTNSLKNDLNHVNQYIVGLALSALGNICSEGMARDTAPEVEKLLNSTNAYIRKKAALCAIRILRKVPDLMESFVPKVKSLLAEKHHGVLITAVSLMIEMCQLDESLIPQFRKMVPQLVKILRSILQYGYSPDYDINGITDPFLQVKILRLLKFLGADDEEASDQMNDLLAYIATNTDGLKNVGNAILYECVNTIMSIDSESGLRVLAINILGKFLANRDNNIRYVALNTLCKVVNIDTEAVQRHRNTVVDCLKDNDISIRRRALELIYSLVNESNVRVLVRELINFLLVADFEFRADLTAKLCAVTEKFAPTPRWRVDTILKVMSIAGTYVPDEVSSNLISLIASTPDLHAYAVQKMYVALMEDISQQSLVQVGVWCIGEFGDLLVQSNSISGEDTPLRVTDDDVIALLTKVLKAATTKTGAKRYVLTALMKLTTRLSTQNIPRLKALLDEYKEHVNVELQQRSVEYGQIFRMDNIRPNLLQRMPAPEIKAPEPEPEQKKPVRQTKELANGSDKGTTSTQPAPTAPPVKNQGGGGGNLIDLLLGDAGSGGGGANTVPVAAPTGGVDLLSLFGGGGATTQPVAPVVNTIPLTPAAPSTQPQQPIGIGMPSLVPLTPSIPLTPTPIGGDLTSLMGGQSIEVLNDKEDGLLVMFEVSKPQPGQPQFTLVNATFTNSSGVSFTEFEMKTAVPKYLKLMLLPASATLIPPKNSQKVTQQIKLANSLHGEKPVMMKLRFEYKTAGTPKLKEASVTLPNM